MSKNVAVFVDVANIFYAAKAAGVDIDYVTLLKAAIAGRDFVRAYAYTGLDPENENQRQFHSFLSRSGYKVVSKDIRKYGDGRIKANLDIELVVDMMKLSRNLDVAVVISGDGDFAPAIRAVQEMGVRVEVISFRGNTSSDLIEAADTFTDIIQLARVETGSSRSGRRVAAEGDLSMTEVPDKETEGAARRRRGGTGRRGERAAEPRTRTGTRDRVAATADLGTARAAIDDGEPAGLPGNLIVLPGEKLSRVPRGTAAAAGSEVDRTPFDEVEDFDDEAAEATEAPAGMDVIEGGLPADDESVDGRRRRRRRGGRGRGRGRGGEQEFAADGTAIVPVAAELGPIDPDSAEAADLVDEEEHDDLEEPPAIRLPAHSTFGSVWDSQLGVPTQPVLPTGAIGDDEFDDEPENPRVPAGRAPAAWPGPRRPRWPRWPGSDGRPRRWSQRRLSVRGGSRAVRARWGAHHGRLAVRCAASGRSGWPAGAAPGPGSPARPRPGWPGWAGRAAAAPAAPGPPRPPGPTAPAGAPTHGAERRSVDRGAAGARGDAAPGAGPQDRWRAGWPWWPSGARRANRSGYGRWSGRGVRRGHRGRVG